MLSQHLRDWIFIIKLKKIKFKKNLLLTSKEKSIIIKDTVRLSVVNVNWTQKINRISNVISIICSFKYDSNLYRNSIYTLFRYGCTHFFVCLIYMRLDLRHTLLSSITSLLIVTFAIGDVASAIWMSQGILMGLICGYFIRKRKQFLMIYFIQQF